MLGGCKHTRSPNLHYKTLKNFKKQKQLGEGGGCRLSTGGSVPSPLGWCKNITAPLPRSYPLYCCRTNEIRLRSIALYSQVLCLCVCLFDGGKKLIVWSLWTLTACDLFNLTLWPGLIMPQISDDSLLADGDYATPLCRATATPLLWQITNRQKFLTLSSLVKELK